MKKSTRNAISHSKYRSLVLLRDHLFKQILKDGSSIYPR